MGQEQSTMWKITTSWKNWSRLSCLLGRSCRNWFRIMKSMMRKWCSSVWNLMMIVSMCCRSIKILRMELSWIHGSRLNLAIISSIFSKMILNRSRRSSRNSRHHWSIWWMMIHRISSRVIINRLISSRIMDWMIYLG